MSFALRRVGGLSHLIIAGCIQCESPRAFSETDTALLQTVAALRGAPASEKNLWLDRLEQSRCDAQAVCRLKGLCMEGYQRFARALESARVARHALRADPAPNSDSTRRSATLLVSAEKLLERARRGMNECAVLEARLRRSRDSNED